MIYQNLEDTSELVVIDPQKQVVVKRYPLAPGKGPTGLAFDAVNRRLFSTCSGQLIVLNADTGSIVAALSIGALTDGVDYDAGLRRVYTAGAIGSMTVIQQDSADRIPSTVSRAAPAPEGSPSNELLPTELVAPGM